MSMAKQFNSWTFLIVGNAFLYVLMVAAFAFVARACWDAITRPADVPDTQYVTVAPRTSIRCTYNSTRGTNTIQFNTTTENNTDQPVTASVPAGSVCTQEAK